MLHFFIRGILFTVPDIIADCPCEQYRFLRDISDFVAQVCLRQIPNIDAVHEHTAARHIIEARDQADQRRFTGTSTANNRSNLAWLGAERNVPDCGLLGSRIAEGHILEFHIAFLITGSFRCIFIVFYNRGHIQHFINPNGRS
ncbi:hypothetical protein D3C78_1437840 [compost metagenome]